MERIGFVGAGLMGEGMALSLLRAGHPVTVVAHRNRAPVERLVAEGAAEAADLAALAKASDVVHVCAPGSPQVEVIVEALLPHLAPGSIVVDCSTANPVSTVALAARLEAAGCAMADAPLGGTPAQAMEGKLSAMVGASEETFRRVEPILRRWADAGVEHVGPCGTGHRMKLLMNFLAMGYGAIYAEALALARKVDIAPARFDEVMRGSRMGCGFYETFMASAVHGQRDAHKFTLTNALKDTTYLAAMAEAAGLANPMGAAIRNSYAGAVNMGGDGAEDYVPHLADFVARANGLD
ncbi:NAD(P)-dependent oxidoreductase [Jannaschia sp. W003]|uniref:NAD(P)-dependent oxidoreductase n=1 Tax=Jannaschia sp. W003 TaxID=2867012 RepID=UPI0021A6F139|nr:NAD(P)-dependent oxidoreductase [Jannaschia sp. W003]UWQ21408.1 NAD(P)-dependent oxidoreductase [Jannaschia sp. W003]